MMPKNPEAIQNTCSKCGLAYCTENGCSRTMAPHSFAGETYNDRTINSSINNCPGAKGEIEEHSKLLERMGLVRLAIHNRTTNGEGN